MSFLNRFFKRLFDLSFSFFLLSFLFPVIFVSWLIASIETRSNGFFIQTRIGKGGFPFKVLKIKTMSNPKGGRSSVSVAGSPDITASGRFFRKYKVDELPQLINVLFGSMSFVGPRPDVPGYADKLAGEDRIVLKVRPGITGPASIKYKNEEEILALQTDPKEYNDNVIWPDKVRINKDYVQNYSFSKDILYIFRTIGG